MGVLALASVRRLLPQPRAAQTPFGLFAQGNRSKTVFAVVPSGTIKGGYDVTPNTSLTVAYNYLYMGSVGRIGDQIASPFDIRQSSVFLQRNYHWNEDAILIARGD